ncbi:MAG: alpha-1,2-fucosyltransferase [Rectinemataceae bacterium]
MQIVKMVGGLGNQMFEYALALALRASGRDVRLDLSWFDRNSQHNGYELERLFGVSIPACSAEERAAIGDVSPSLFAKVRRRFIYRKRTHYRQAKHGYDPAPLSSHGDLYLDGFWQSYRYFDGMEDSIRKVFSFPTPLGGNNARVLQDAAGRTTIGVHVRRGDQLANDTLGIVCGASYFRRAIQAALVDAMHPLVIFFSDDLPWCEKELGTGLDAVYVDWNRKADSYLDMQFMTRCDRLVISNSTFSWWGAWLGADPGRFVASPDRWAREPLPDYEYIIHPNWTKISSRASSSIELSGS